MIYLANAFSGQMVPDFCVISKKLVTKERVQEHLRCEWESCVGHKDTAAVLSDLLEIPVPHNRVNVMLTQDDLLIVAQVQGGRLPEGATTLPDDFQLVFHQYQVLTI